MHVAAFAVSKSEITFSSLKLQLLSDIQGLHTTTYGGNLTLLVVGQTKIVFQCHCETMLRVRELSHSPPPPLRVQLHVNVMREFFKIRAILCFLAGLCSAPHYFARTNTHLQYTLYAMSDMRSRIFDFLVEIKF